MASNCSWFPLASRRITIVSIFFNYLCVVKSYIISGSSSSEHTCSPLHYHGGDKCFPSIYFRFCIHWLMPELMNSVSFYFRIRIIFIVGIPLKLAIILPACTFYGIYAYQRDRGLRVAFLERLTREGLLNLT